MKKTLPKSVFILILTLLSTNLTWSKTPPVSLTTICNPVDLSYRFCFDGASRKEAADPSMVLYKGEYYLFLSKSGGYFHSTNMVKWNLITTEDLPLENYAPTGFAMGEKLYFKTSKDDKIYSTSDPKSGKWEIATENFSTRTDPMIFPDDNGKLYYYVGCSNRVPITEEEVDPLTLKVVGDSFNEAGVTKGTEYLNLNPY